ncbi:MAG: LCP family protein [Acidimicrobiales bacterium]
MSGDGQGGHESPDERDRRLAALLSVDIGAAVRAHAEQHDSTRTSTPIPVPARRQRPTWFVVLAFGVLAGLLLAGVGLAYAGTRLIRSSTEGEVFTPVNDPTAPGFEALVDPTPTLVMLHDVDGLLDAITVLTLPDPDGAGGGVVLVPDRTVADIPAFGDIPVEAAYDLGDAQFAAQSVSGLLGAAMLETAVVDAGRWADLVAPVAPITLDNPNELRIDGDVRFPIGTIDLEASDVAAYLEADDFEGSDLARLARHQLFWEAWLEAVEDEGTAGAVPGELDSGIGRFVRTLARGSAVVETLPVRPVGDDRYGPERAFFPEGGPVTELLTRLVPFPVSSAPGARARLRLLNGTTDTSIASSVAADLPPAGVELVLIGNAGSLDHDTTTVRYVGEETREEALAIVDILGVGEVVEEPRPTDAADITVTLGADYG